MIKNRIDIGRRFPAFILVLLISGWVASAVAAVAMVTDLQGKAVVGDGGKSSEATILTELAVGAQVQLASGGTLVVLYFDSGDEYIFRGPAQIIFGSNQPDARTGARPERRPASLGAGGKDIRIKPVAYVQAAIVMRSARSATRIRLLGLQNTRTVDISPEFRWQQLQPGLKYQFEIADDTGRVLYEEEIDADVLRLPASVRLNEDAGYTWEVSTRTPEGRKYSSVGEFSIAPVALRAQVQILKPADSAPLSTRVAYAVWLDQMELRDEARKYWRVLAADRPEDSRLKALAEQ